MRGKRLGAIVAAGFFAVSALAQETRTFVDPNGDVITVAGDQSIQSPSPSSLPKLDRPMRSGGIIAIPEFTGERQEGWETQCSCDPPFYPCVPNGRMFQDIADMCATDAHITGGWGFRCSISPHGGSWLYGSTGSPSEITFDDGWEALQIGGWFGTNAGEQPDADVEFYDIDDNLIDTLVADVPIDCSWVWNGWESSIPIKRMVITGNNPFGGGYIMLDDMEYSQAEPAFGACCFSDGECLDDVQQSECIVEGGDFTADTLCDDLDPPCEEQSGRCCIDGDNPECAVITRTECGQRGGDFAGFGTDCVDDPCGFAEGACCIFPDCIGTMRLEECLDLGGAWFEGETCPEFQCPEIIDCLWDNDLRPNGINGRAISPPSFPDIRVVDDVTFNEPGCQLGTLDANVIEDAGWVSGNTITVYAYEDTGSGPGALMDSVDTSFVKVDTGDQYFGRNDYDYLIEGVGLDLPGGTSWIGMRNADGSGAGTNYWMTSDGGTDGGGSDTGWFSLDGGGTWSPEGPTWHHAFEILPPPANGACCLPDGSCTDDVPSSECRDAGGRFGANTLCADLEPPCAEQIGRCCIEGGGGCMRDPEWLCDGDTDGDGQVNAVDSGLIQAAFGSDDPADLCQYDVDCDGQINPVDSGLVQALFGTCEEPRDSCGGGGGDPVCAVITGTECRDRGGEFGGFGTDCEDDPCGFATGACCLELECLGTTREAECDERGGSWFRGQTCPEFECPDVLACGWDNGMVPNGVNGRAISPPSFPDIRVVDDIVAEQPGCTILNFHANVIEDAGWTDDGMITVYVYEDTGSGPGALFASVDTEYTKMDTGDDYFGRDDYDYWIEGLSIDLPVGTSWVGMRNAGGGGAGTNYWMTSDGGSDGPTSDTGWFSLDGGNTFAPEGDTWDHAFEIIP